LSFPTPKILAVQQKETPEISISPHVSDVTYKLSIQEVYSPISYRKGLFPHKVVYSPISYRQRLFPYKVV